MKRSHAWTSGLALGAILASSLAASAPARASEPQDGRAHGGRIKNVTYLLGDGMGRTHVTAGRQRFYGASGRLAMETLPAHGYVQTYAVEKNSGQPGQKGFVPNLVTDSASAATAWASGVKTYNAALGVDAKGRVKPTVMELAKKAGYRTGNVSTAEITDATPASQMSHVLARGCQGPTYSKASCQDIDLTGSPLPTSDIRVTPAAKQIARNGTADVIFGGGLARFDAADGRALAAQGYQLLSSPSKQKVATRSDLGSATGPKVFGLFNKGNLTIEKVKADHPKAPEAHEPTLAEMTRTSIDLLSASEGGRSSGKGFYLQVEGALIDKRSHANDAAQALAEIKAFDDAVKVAYDFAKKDGNTLVIVTADHECAGFSIIEKDTFTNAEAANPPVNVDTSNSANNSALSRPDSNIKDKKRSTGIVNGIGARDPHNFAPATFRTADDPTSVRDGSPEASLWLSYLSGNHTGADVPIFAYGAGSEQLQRTIDNTDLFRIVTKALRVG